MTSETGARRARSKRRENRGFTLVELAVVAALFCAMFSLSWPAFSSLYRGYQTESAARDLAVALALARGRAVIERKSVVFDLNRHLPENAMGPKAVRFHANGTATPAEWTFANSGGASRKYKVMLNGFTGLAQVNEVQEGGSREPGADGENAR